MSGSWGPPPPPEYPPARRTPAPDPGGSRPPRLPVVVAVVGLLALLVMAGAVTLVALSDRDDESRARDVPSAPPSSPTSPTPSEPSTTTTTTTTSASPTPDPPDPTPSAPALPDPDLAAGRDATSTAARSFVEVVNSYGPNDLRSDGTMGGYRARVAELLTPAFADTFASSVVPVEARVASLGLTRTGDVDAVGVAVLRRDSAQVVVTAEVTTVTDDAEASSTFGQYVAVSLVRREGDWRVDGLTILGGQPGPGLGGTPGARVEPEVADARDAALEAAPGRPSAAGVAAVTAGTVEVVVVTEQAELRALVVTMVRRGDNWVADSQVQTP